MSSQPSHRLSLPISSTKQEATGWKPRSLSESSPMERRAPTNTRVKKWDGAARASVPWDSLRRDPELWFRGGNCFIHLYGKGQSQRGPAFKVPLGALLSAHCHPLLQRCISRDSVEVAGLGFDEFEDLELWNAQNPTRRVDLFIPAPPTADKDNAFLYHVTTRNFFAWVFRRSLVGEHLGAALSDLLDTMAEFRADEQDNVADILDYMDEEGYLGVDSHPVHAVAVLRFAEAHQLRDAYIHAFTHCTGMSEHLASSPEYDHITPVSKRFIRRSRLEMDLRLGKAGKALQTFLEDDLCEPTLTLPPGGRAHLDRFRSFLLSFYSSRLGYYPPPTVDSRNSMFERHIYEDMHEDFRALYEFLVDEASTASDRLPTDGDISVIQCVLAFDSRRRYMTLEHPFPLLPEVTSFSAGRRQTWLSRGDKLSPDQRLLAHAALVRATNMDVRILENGLVRAYRKFEEHMVAPTTKVDRSEKISLADARKVRWIMIYGLYQVLRQCVNIPSEVSDTDVDYNLCVAVDNLPPWEHQIEQSSPTHSQGSWDQQSTQHPPTVDFSMDIRPDLDYMAMMRKAEQAAQVSQAYSWSISGGPAPADTRTRSLKSAHASTFRRSMSIFHKKSEPAPAESANVSRRNSMFHEIVVHGYGNGTNAMAKASTKASAGPPVLPEIDTSAAAFRSPSVLSKSSYSSSTYTDAESHISTGTADSSVPSGSPKTGKSEPGSAVGGPPILSPIPLRSRRKEVLSMMSHSELRGEVRRPVTSSAAAEPKSAAADYARGYAALVEEERDRVELCPAPLQIRKTFPSRHSFAGTPQGCAASVVSFGGESPLWEPHREMGGRLARSTTRA